LATSALLLPSLPQRGRALTLSRRSSDAAEHLRSLDDDLKQKHGCARDRLDS